jgi:cytidine deaminase
MANTESNAVSKMATLLDAMASQAWTVREHAHAIGGTKVGCAVAASGKIFVGCNVEHRFRCHDIHAEVNAIGSMISAGASALAAVVIVADRDYFTPCGGCMDWIMQFGSTDTPIAFQRSRNGPLITFLATELMPHYPK